MKVWWWSRKLFYSYLFTSLAAGLWGGWYAVLRLAGYDNLYLRIALVAAAILTAEWVWRKQMDFWKDD